jgi:aryl-alcohol dehydrogenase-like predicted oxidoreductase
MVGAIGLGGMALSYAERPAEPDAIALIHTLLDRGVTLIDTADVYTPDEGDRGHNERLIAKALRGWPGARQQVIIATKGGYIRRNGQLVPQGNPDHLRRACEASLRALATDRIDLYQLHTMDPAVPLADSVGAISRLQEEGKVRWIGLSNVTVTAIDRAREIAPVQTVQNELSVLRHDSLAVGPVARLEHRGIRWLRQLRRLVGEPFQSGVVAHCERLGIGFLASSPLGGSRNGALRGNPVIERIASAHGASVYAIAIGWLLARGEHLVPIPSARRRVHAEDTLTGDTITLTRDECDALGAAF